MNLNKLKKVHFVGLGGIGVSAVAKLMLAQGKIVSGSDLARSEITDELVERGVQFFNNSQPENITSDMDLLIYSLAVPEDNPERVQAKKLKIKQLAYPEFLGMISRDKYTIAISGTDGKSTTTAMLGLILEKAGLDPTVIVGSKIKSLKDGNLRIGQSKYLVVEACEYQKAMLNLEPDIIVITNIRPEHLDCYGTFDNLKKTFQQYANKLPNKGLLIVNADDETAKALKTDQTKLTYSLDSQSDFKVKSFRVEDQKQIFQATFKQEDLGDFKLIVPGRFNIYNASGAITAALALGIKPEIIKDALASFANLWRRFEKIGENNGAIIISDFGHTPEAIKGTILAAKEFYPDRRLLVVYQPHHHDRTKRFFKEFTESFDEADLLIVNEIYDVKGREDANDQDVSSQDLVREIEKRNKDKKIIYSSGLEETKKLVLENMKDNDLVILIGAGDIYQIANNLVKKEPIEIC
ncbi:MAG: UDP-N-acetylmuramate--L-alanine ligase [bacterium]